MTTKEMRQLGAVLDKLAQVYRTTLDVDTRELYYRVLNTVSFDLALAACDSWLMGDHEFFPRPGQLRILALNLPGNASTPEALKARATQAWENLRGTAIDVYNRWALTDPVTHQVFRIMGGGYLTDAGFGRWPSKQEGFKRREFFETYVGLAGQFQTLPPLPAEPLALPPTERADYDDSGEGAVEDRRAEVRQLLYDVAAKLAIPPAGVPKCYLREHPMRDSLAYTPLLTSDEFEARRRLLLRQSQMLMAHALSTQGEETSPVASSGAVSNMPVPTRHPRPHVGQDSSV